MNKAEGIRPVSRIEESLFAFANHLGGWVPFVRKTLDRSARDHALQAEAFHEKGDDLRAMEEYETALLRAPRDVAILDAAGQTCYESDVCDAAEMYFRRALDVDYFDKRALKGLAFTLHTVNRVNDAIYAYIRYLDLEPKEYTALLNLGALLHDTGRYADAIVYSRRASEIPPPQALAFQNLANSHFSLGNFSDAEAAIRRALELSPDHDSWRILGLVQEAQDQTEAALESYSRACEASPESGSAWLDRARMLQKVGRYDDYLADARRSAELFERDGDTYGLAGAYWDLGWAYYTLRDWQSSIEASRKAAELDPANAPPRFNLGLALLRLHRAGEAKAEYAEAMKISKISDLKNDGINDLEAALREELDLPGARDILTMLYAEYNKIEKQRTRTT